MRASVITTLLFAVGASLLARVPAAAAETLDEWISHETPRATTYLLANVSPEGALPGAIVASPSRTDPNYYYHWVRDSGIAVRALSMLYMTTLEPDVKQRLLEHLKDFISFSSRTQAAAQHDGIGLGEARFTVRGAHVPGPWGEPQDDGPATRAIELIHVAFLFLAEDQPDLARQAQAVIRTDLEFVAANWRRTCFDAWEELRGHHFYTRLLERKALVAGSLLATRLGDPQAASRYLAQANLLGAELVRHWDPARGYLVSTLDRDGGIDYKRSNLDSSVVVATLGGYSPDDLHDEDLFPVDDERVLATAAAVERTFAALYPINDPLRGIPGIAIGRYPEDRYDGLHTNATGNPWPSLTLASAMFYYKLAVRYASLGTIQVTAVSAPFFAQLPLPGGALTAATTITRDDVRFRALLTALRLRGDWFLERVRRHTAADGSLAEQMNRDTGFEQGAPHLSMSYAAFLLAVDLRSSVAPQSAK